MPLKKRLRIGECLEQLLSNECYSWLNAMEILGGQAPLDNIEKAWDRYHAIVSSHLDRTPWSLS